MFVARLVVLLFCISLVSCFSLSKPASLLSVACTDLEVLNAWLDAGGNAEFGGEPCALSFENDSPYSSNLVCGETYDVNFIVNDGCGNGSDSVVEYSGIFTLTILSMIVEPTPLSLPCDASINTEVDEWLASGAGATVVMVAPVEICDDPTVNYSNSYEFVACGVAAVTFEASSFCGQSLIYTVELTWTEDVPNFSFSSAAGSTLDIGCNDPIIDNWLASGGGVGASAENCNGDQSVSYSNDFNSLSACGETFVTFTVQDNCGNAQTYVSIVTRTVLYFMAPPSDFSTTCTDTNGITNWLDANANAQVIVSDDSCSQTLVTYNNYYADEGCGIFEIFFTAMDQCGNSLEYSAQLTKTDPNADLALVTEPTALNTDCSNTNEINTWLSSGGGAEIVGCGDITILNDFTVLNPCGDTEVIFTAQDGCSEDINFSSLISSTDSTGPTIVTSPTDFDGPCSEFQTWLSDHGGAIFSDFCDVAAPEMVDPEVLEGECDGEVSFVAIDACGNESTITSTFSVTETLEFTLQPTSETVECSDDANTLFLAWTNSNASAEASSDCGGEVIIQSEFSESSTDDCSSSETFVVTATGVCGTSISASATFTIEDTTAPEVTEASPLTVVCGDDAAIEEWLTAYGGAIVTDVCSEETVITNDYENFGDCLPTTTVTFTATDGCGLFTTFTALLTLTEDSGLLQINTEPSELTVDCSDTASINAWLDAGAEAVVAYTADNDCDSPDEIIEFTNNYDPASSCGAQNVTFTASDTCQNTLEFVVELTKTADTVIVLTTEPSDLSVPCYDYDSIYTWLNNGANAVAETSDCDLGNVIIYTNDFDSYSPCGESVVTFTASDQCGNTLDYSVTLNRNEIFRLVTDPTNLSTECSDTAGINSWLDSGANAVVEAVDCGGDVSFTNTFDPTSPCGESTVSFTVSDSCGNTESVYTMTLTRTDNSSGLVISTPPTDLSTSCDNDIEAIDAWLSSGAGAVVDNNCNDEQSTTSITNDYVPPQYQPCTTTISVTFTAQDECGNALTYISSIEFVFQSIIFIQEPTALSIACDNDEERDAWLSSGGGAEVLSTYCDPNTATISSDFDSNSPCGVYEVTFVATDECGNSLEYTAQLELLDIDDLYIEVEPEDLTIDCGEDVSIQEWLDNGANAMVLPFTCENSPIEITNDYEDGTPCGVSVVTFTAEDECGNTLTYTAELSRTDSNSGLVIVTPASDLGVECGNSVAIQEWLDSAAGAVVTNECSDDLSITYFSNNYEEVVNDCEDVVVTFTAEDECGNALTFDASIIIETIVENFVFETEPSELSVECNTESTGSSIDEWLEAGANAVITTDCLTSGIVTVTNNYEEDALCGVYNVTFTAEDVCGNTLTYVAQLNKTEEEPDIVFEMIGDPENLSVECDDSESIQNWLANGGNAIVVYSGDCDDSTIIYENDFSDGPPCGESIVQFTASVICGEFFNYTASLNRTDSNSAFVIITEPTPLTADCFDISGIFAWLDAGGNIEIETSCNETSIFYSYDYMIDYYNSCTEPVESDVSFIASDTCGNTISFTSSITRIAFINFDTDPEFSFTVECSDQAAVDEWLATGGGAEISSPYCDTSSEVQITNNFDSAAPCGESFVVFSVTDACENYLEYSAIITRTDSTNELVIISEGSDLEVECGDTAIDEWLDTGAGAALETACDVSPEVTITNDYYSSNYCISNFITFTATDACGNSLTYLAFLQQSYDYTGTGLQLTTPPTPLNVDCGDEDSIAEWLMNGGDAEVTQVLYCYNPTISFTSNFVNDDSCGEFEVEFSAFDVCGSTLTYDAILIKVAPLFEVEVEPVPLTVECSDTPTIEAWLENGADIILNDIACESGIFTFTSDFVADAPCGEAVVSFTAEDECGNQFEFTSIIIRNDTDSGLVIVTPASDLGVECGNSVAIQEWLDSAAGAVVTNECSDDLSITYFSNNYEEVVNDCEDVVVTFTAEDECGNALTFVASIIIESSNTYSLQVIELPYPLVVPCDDPTNQIGEWLSIGGGAMFEDNYCAIYGITFENNFDESSPCGESTVTFVATSPCGSMETYNVTLVREETSELSMIVEPYDLSTTCDASDIEGWLLSGAGAEVNAPTTCDDATVTFENDFVAGSTCGSYNVTFVASDSCENILTFSASLSISSSSTGLVFESESGFINIPCDEIIELDQWLESGAGAVVSDGCGDVSITNDFDFESPCGESIVTFNVTSVCGESLTYTEILIRTDPNAGLFVEVAPISLSVDCTNTTAIEEWLSNAGDALVLVTGDCDSDEVTFTNNFEEVEVSPCGESFITFTASDSCGNAITFISSIETSDAGSPDFTVAPSDFSGNCTEYQSWLNTYGGAEVVDSCSAPENLVWNTITNPIFICAGEVDFAVIDPCGNEIVATASYALIDESVPDFAPQDLILECGEDISTLIDEWTVSAGYASEFPISDCGDVRVIATSYDVNSSYDGCSYNETYAFTATTDCGATNIQYASILSYDTTSPVVQIAPEPLFVPCADISSTENWLSAGGDAFITDACSGSNFVITNDFEADSPCGESIVTFTVSDNCGNAITYTSSITREDSNSPLSVVVSGSDIAVECNEVTLVEEWLENGAYAELDTQCDLGTNITITNNFLDLYFESQCVDAVVTFLAEDECGNALTYVASITITYVSDVSLEILEEATPFEYNCETTTESDLLNWLDASANAVVEGCGELIFSNDFTSIENFCGATDVEFIVEDECSNYISYTSQIITFNQGPIFTTLPTSFTGTCAEYAEWIQNEGGAVVTNYECGTFSLEIMEESYSYETCGGEVQFIATDSCGNTVTETANYNIIDGKITTFPESITVSCGTGPSISEWLDENSAIITVDNSCSDGFESIRTQFFDASSNDCVTSETFEFIALSQCGTSSAYASYTVEDTEAPILFSGPTTFVGECTDFNRIDEWLSFAGNAELGDTCSLVSISNDYTINPYNCYDGQSIIVTFTASDACGNTVEFFGTMEFTSSTTSGLTISFEPIDLFVECGDTDQIQIYLSNDGYSEVTTPTDCGTVLITNDYDFSSACGQTAVTFTATDACGNSLSYNAIITATNPGSGLQISREPEALSVGCGEDRDSLIDEWLSNGAYAQVTVTGFCDYDFVSISYNQDIEIDACGETFVTFTANDECGNAFNYVSSIISSDLAGPELLEEPMAFNGDCTEFQNWIDDYAGAQISDSCTSDEDLVWNINTNAVYLCAGEVEFIVMDTCGNELFFSSAYTIDDQFTSPDFSPQDLVVECGDDWESALLEWTSNAGGSAVPVSPCGDVSVSAVFSDEIINENSCTYQEIFEFTAVTDCGASSVAYADFIIQDSTAPIITSGPEFYLAECGDIAAIEEWLSTGANVQYFDDCFSQVTFSNDLAIDEVTCGSTIEVNFVVSDECGNSSFYTSNLEVEYGDVGNSSSSPSPSRTPSPSRSAVPNCDECYVETIEIVGDGSLVVVETDEILISSTSFSAGDTLVVASIPAAELDIPTLGLASEIVSLNLYDSEGNLIQPNGPVVICIQVDPNYSTDGLCLAYINDLGDWECEFLDPLPNPFGLLCGETTHFTLFGMLKASAIASTTPSPSPSPFGNDSSAFTSVSSGTSGTTFFSISDSSDSNSFFSISDSSDSNSSNSDDSSSSNSDDDDSNTFSIQTDSDSSASSIPVVLVLVICSLLF